MNSRLLPGLLLGALFFSTNISASEEFESWKQKQNESFKSYITKERAEFKKALESEWESFKLAQPRDLYSEPKIDVPPAAPIKATPQVDIPKEKPVPDLPVTPDTPISIPEPIVQPDTPNQIEINYLARNFQLPEMAPKYLPLKTDNESIANAWESLYPDLDVLVEAIVENSQISHLPDWAFISLLELYSQQVNHNEPNGTQLLLWGLLMELGYDARLACDDVNLYLLLPSQQKVYGKPSINIDGTDYYILLGKLPTDSVYSYDVSSHPEEYFDFSFADNQPVQGLVPEKKTLSDSTTGLSVTYLTFPQLQDYYRSHPALDFIWYFRISLQDNYYLQLIDDLKEKLSGYPAIIQVQVLLSLVQHGFKYERDDEQWGEEYYSPPMHTLMLNAVDCEDRSFLFSYLVKKVVGIDTVGLKYPGHLSVAVALKESDIDSEADFVTVNGRKFFVADPTYIGAPIGLTMPMFKDVMPTVISD